MFDMPARSLLKIALQVIGAVLFIRGTCLAIIYVGSLFGQPAPFHMQATTVLLAIIPPLFGLYLLIKTEPLVRRLYGNADEKVSSGPDLFILAMKITGMVLIVYALPDFIQLLSSILYIMNVSPAMSIAVQVQMLANKLASTILYVVFGIYLLLDGGLFLRLAFPDTEGQPGDHGDEN